MVTAMKSLVLLTFLSLSPGAHPTLGKAEYFNDETSCQQRMAEIRASQGSPGKVRCTCHVTVPEVTVEGNDGI